MISVFGVFFHPTDKRLLRDDIPILPDFDSWESVGMDQFISTGTRDSKRIRYLQDGQIQGQFFIIVIDCFLQVVLLFLFVFLIGFVVCFIGLVALLPFHRGSPFLMELISREKEKTCIANADRRFWLLRARIPCSLARSLRSHLRLLFDF